jgi:aminoglycoside phosphotransferase (APT) family kinase protein
MSDNRIFDLTDFWPKGGCVGNPVDLGGHGVEAPVGRKSAVSATLTVDFDRASLERFARREFGEPLAEFLIDRVAGGQSNPTYFVTLGGHRMVLRKKPSGETLPSAHAVDREHRVLSALAGTGVPVPKTILYGKDLSVVGTPFYLMERLEGRIFHDTSLPGVAPADREAMIFDMADTLAKLHDVNPSSVGLGDFGRPQAISSARSGAGPGSTNWPAGATCRTSKR